MGIKLPNVTAITSEVQRAIDNKTSSLMSGFDPYNMDEAAIDTKIDGYTGIMDDIEKVTDAIDIGRKAIRVIKDPVGGSLSVAKELALQEIQKWDKYQEFKDDIIEKVKEKAMEIPQVQTIVDKVQDKVNDITALDIPEDVKKLVNNPEDASENVPNVAKYVYQAIMDSGLSRQLMSMGNKKQ